VVFLTNDDSSAGAVLTPKLCVATQAKIRVRLHEQFAIDRTVRRVTRRAAFAQRFVFEHDALRLRAMTTRALFIQSCHRESTRRLHDVLAVWVVTLHAVHLPFTHRVMLGKIELRVDLEVAGKARLRIAPWIHNEFSVPATGCDVLAAGAMTRFAARAARHFCRVHV